jgi:hypothetical protein
VDLLVSVRRIFRPAEESVAGLVVAGRLLCEPPRHASSPRPHCGGHSAASRRGGPCCRHRRRRPDPIRGGFPPDRRGATRPLPKPRSTPREYASHPTRPQQRRPRSAAQPVAAPGRTHPRPTAPHPARWRAPGATTPPPRRRAPQPESRAADSAPHPGTSRHHALPRAPADTTAHSSARTTPRPTRRPADTTPPGAEPTPRPPRRRADILPSQADTTPQPRRPARHALGRLTQAALHAADTTPRRRRHPTWRPVRINPRRNRPRCVPPHICADVLTPIQMLRLDNSYIPARRRGATMSATAAVHPRGRAHIEASVTPGQAVHPQRMRAPYQPRVRAHPPRRANAAG